MRLQQLTIRNFRVLKDVTFTDLTPLTVLCGANGAGKSTLLEALGFLREVFAEGLRPAWARSRQGGDPYSYGDPVEIDLRLTQVPERWGSTLGYHVSFERAKTRFVVNERVWWEGADGVEDVLLEFERGNGWHRNKSTEKEVHESLADDDQLAVSVLAQLQPNSLLRSLRNYFRAWHLSDLSPEGIRLGRRGEPHAGVSRSGDTLFSVLFHLKRDKEHVYNEILRAVRHHVPLMSDAEIRENPDGIFRMLLWDRPFKSPALTPHISDGTLKLFALFTLLHDPRPVPLIGVEEPENHVHPKLLYPLAEEFREASARSQIFITTHAPELVDAIRPDELWTVSRSDDGYTKVRRASDDAKVVAMMEAGAHLGDLWSEGFLSGADPAGIR